MKISAVLFPILVAAILYQHTDAGGMHHHSPGIRVPSLRLPTLRMPKLRLPTLNIPKLRLPTLNIPKLRLPTLRIPKLRLPTLRFPVIPLIRRPQHPPNWSGWARTTKPPATTTPRNWSGWSRTTARPTTSATTTRTYRNTGVTRTRRRPTFAPTTPRTRRRPTTPRTRRRPTFAPTTPRTRRRPTFPPSRRIRTLATTTPQNWSGWGRTTEPTTTSSRPRKMWSSWSRKSSTRRRTRTRARPTFAPTTPNPNRRQRNKIRPVRVTSARSSKYKLVSRSKKTTHKKVVEKSSSSKKHEHTHTKSQSTRKTVVKTVQKSHKSTVVKKKGGIRSGLRVRWPIFTKMPPPPTTEASTEPPTTEEPYTEPPTTIEPTTEEPYTEEPTTDEPTIYQPTTEPPTTEEPITDEPYTEEPTDPPTDKTPTTEDPYTEPPTTEEPITDEPQTTEEPMTPTGPFEPITPVVVEPPYEESEDSCCVPGNLKLDLTGETGERASSRKKAPGLHVQFDDRDCDTAEEACGATALITADFEIPNNTECGDCVSTPSCGRSMLVIALKLSRAERMGTLVSIGDKTCDDMGQRKSQVKGVYPNVTITPSICSACGGYGKFADLINAMHSSAKHVTIYVSNNHIRVTNNLGLDYSVCHECVFDLNRQTNADGSQRVLIGLNRAIKQLIHPGYGVCSADISWACPW